VLYLKRRLHAAAENNRADALIFQEIIGEDATDLEKSLVSVRIIPDFGEVFIADVEIKRTFLLLCKFIVLCNLFWLNVWEALFEVRSAIFRAYKT
jgi:hypothetical protein